MVGREMSVRSDSYKGTNGATLGSVWHTTQVAECQKLDMTMESEFRHEMPTQSLLYRRATLK